MDSKPFASDEFNEEMSHAFAIAGTVALPSPYPASGPLFMGINPNFNKDLISGLPEFFLRSVQNVSPSEVITRIVGLDELRAVSLPVPPESHRHQRRIFKTVNSIFNEIQTVKESLDAAIECNEAGVYEQLLFEDAIIYVREAAPVFVRIVHEYGVTAVEATENIGQLTPEGSRCCFREIS